MTVTAVEHYAITAESAAELSADLLGLASTPGVRCVMVVDRGGRIIASAGDSADTDATALASLAAADFNANEQLARLVGEPGFRALVHTGDNSSVHLDDVGGRAVVVTLYETGTPPGLVRELAREASDRVAMTLDRMAAKAEAGSATRQPPLAGAEAEIDRLFDW